MIRNLKVLGLAVVAVLALTALAASSASAANFVSTDGAAHVTIEGAQEGTHTFETDPGTVHCKKATFSGTTTKSTTPEVTVTPAYSECTLTSIFGNIAVTVSMNECDYLFTAGGEVHIVCPAGKTISVSGPGCSITVPGPQTVSKNTFTNLGAGTTMDVQVHTEVTGIEYSYSGFTCGSGSGTKNGKYVGKTTITGVNTNLGHEGITWEAT